MLRAEQAYRDLLELSSQGISLGLDRVRSAMERLGRPDQGRPWIVVAGTNGKGSTSAFIASILDAAGYRVGLYTSPHLLGPRERIRVAGECIGEDDFGRLAEQVLALTRSPEDNPLTFFEALTCMALLHFRERDVEMGVLEVGLGGRLDAVNVVHPTLTVIGSIALDHMDYLGADLDTIANEKAGILRPRVPLALNVSEDLFRRVIGPRCLEQRIPVMKVGRDAVYELDMGVFSYRGSVHRIHDIALGLEGRFQGANAALAVAAIEQLSSRGFRVDTDAVVTGLRRARWPGRFQVLATTPPLVLDVAHNPAGAEALVDSLRARFGPLAFHVCLAVKRTKDVEGMLAALRGVASALTLTTDDSGELVTPDEIRAETLQGFENVTNEPDIARAVASAFAAHAAGIPTLVTGSHRLVAAALAGRYRVC